jgi:hypothetical protein
VVASPQPVEAICPPVLHRVGHLRDPLRFSEIDALDADLADFGNRFDVPGAGVLYAATDKEGAFKETLATFRPAASSQKYASTTHMNLGAVPAEWRDARRIVDFGLSDPLPFLDVEADETLSFLTHAMAPALAFLGYERLDSSIVRGPDRRLTRGIARWAYTQVDEDDEAVYSGLRFSSRFQSHECWAIFSGVEISDFKISTLSPNDTALQSAARSFALTVH